MNDIDEKRNEIIRNPTKIQLQKKCKRIITGPHHSYAIADELVYFWGLKHTYQIPEKLQGGENIANQNNALNSKLVIIPIIVQQIATGTSHSFAWNRSEVYCWGSNLNYELGLQEQRDYPVTKVEAFEQAIQQGCNLRKIGCGQHHTLAYFYIDQQKDKDTFLETDCFETQVFQLPQDKQDKSGVQLYVWGQSQSLQLTINTFDIIPYPVLSPYEIYCKNDFNVALCSGKVYSWGSNIFSRLGLNTTSSQSPKIRIPKEVSLSEKIIKIGIGTYHVVAIGQSGVAFSWGKGNQGQLGIDRFETQSRPAKMVCTERIVDVSCGQAHTMVMLQDGRLKTCGSNSHGALGHLHYDLNDKKKRAKKLQFVMNLQNVKQIVSISCGNNHNLILNKFGQVFGWGKNQHYQVIPQDTLKNGSYREEKSRRQFKLIQNSVKKALQRFEVKQQQEDRNQKMHLQKLLDWKRRYKIFKEIKNREEQKYLQQLQKIMQSFDSKSCF